MAVSLVLLCATAGAEGHERGQELFELCVQCHGPAGGGDPVSLAPAIAGMDEWYVQLQLENFKKGARGLHPQDLGGLRMYPMATSLYAEGDLEAVASYVASLPVATPAPTLVGGDATRGAGLYTVCGSCHGPDGAGNEAMKAPQLRGLSDWYLKSSLEKYKAGTRGANPANPNGAIMRGMAATLADEQAILDLIAHVMTFKAGGE